MRFTELRMCACASVFVCAVRMSVSMNMFVSVIVFVSVGMLVSVNACVPSSSSDGPRTAAPLFVHPVQLLCEHERLIRLKNLGLLRLGQARLALSACRRRIDHTVKFQIIDVASDNP